ncbi:hypothetical protein CBS101457_001205 [Exobasidium rhododendri]|nr:hypothetical protein CBS101457_001205 [Exobasidium rhododendri]
MSLTLPSPGTISGALRSLRHVQPLPKVKGGKFANKSNTFARTSPNFVQPKDRVAFWNIAPGDEVIVTVGARKVKNEESGEVEKIPYEGIVGSIDRERNLVWLRAAADAKDESRIPRNIKHILPRLKDPDKGIEAGYSPNTAYVVRPVHYSNLKLKLPSDLNLPKDVSAELNLKSGVYASRITRSKVHYNNRLGMYEWKRFAVVQSPKGGVLKIEVPWRKPEAREKERRTNQTLLKTVDSETWIPWHPSDPFRILSQRSWTSPQALKRFHASQRQSTRDTKVQDEKKQIAAEAAPADREGTYAGFAIRGVKAPALPQAPTPAEQLWQAREDRSHWLHTPPVLTRQQAGGKAFAAMDYLHISPQEGPSSSLWNALPIVSESGNTKRETRTGELESVSKREVDGWPIELLMENDLTNKMGLKHRMRRWSKRQANLTVEQEEAAKQEKLNIAALKNLKDRELRDFPTL